MASDVTGIAGFQLVRLRRGVMAHANTHTHTHTHTGHYEEDVVSYSFVEIKRFFSETVEELQVVHR